MKIFGKIITLTLSLLLALSILASCGLLPGPTVDGESATVVLDLGDGEYKTYEIKLADVADLTKGAYSLLLHLNENEGLALDAPDSTYGVYINSVGELVPDLARNEYVAIYTSVEKDFAVPTADFPTVSEVVYNGRTLKSAGVGLSSMSVTDGAVILFRIETF